MKGKIRHLVMGAVMVVTMFGGTTIATSTPGGLDSKGGHHCWTNCKSYGTYTGKYHCHKKPCNKKTIRRHRRHGH